MHLGLDHPVAVKVLKEHVGTSKEEVARFQREAITTCRIQHPNAVTMYDFGIAGRGMPYIVMELLVGRPLQGEMDEFVKIDPMRTAQIVVPICDLLAAAHEQGVVHRDLKPGNVFLHESRAGEIVKVLDFGIAGLLHLKKNEEKLTRDGGLVGTPTYMAPERLQGQQYDGRSDVYSLGILLYEMLCGHAPFESEVDPVAVMVMHVTELPKPLRLSVPEIPQRLEDLVLSMLDKDPSRRPRVDQVGRELAQLFGLDVPRSLKGKTD
jgi:serine/threonine protein kinase